MKTKVISFFLIATMLLSATVHAEPTKATFNTIDNITIETPNDGWKKNSEKEIFTVEKENSTITVEPEKVKLEELEDYNCQMTLKNNDEEIFIVGHTDKAENLPEIIAILNNVKIAENDANAKDTVKEVNVPYFVIVDSSLNVREAPTTNSKAIGKLKNNDEITVEAFVLNEETTSVWAQIKYNDKSAFVSANYIKPKKESKVKDEKKTDTPTDNNTNNSASEQENNTSPASPTTPPSNGSNTEAPSNDGHTHNWVTKTRVIRDAWDETVTTSAPWDETVVVTPAWDETVTTSEAWDETVVTNPAWDEQVWHDGQITGYQSLCECGTYFNTEAELNNHQFQASLNNEPGHVARTTVPVYSDGYYETINHPAETTVVHHDAQTTVVHHDAETTTVHHDAGTTTVHHDAEVETYQVCSTCGATR